MYLRLVGVITLLHGLCLGDIFMTNPRGSNNRLNEKGNGRRNGNRLFDSQNNNKGGYNVAEKTSGEAKNYQEQYRVQYFESGPNGNTDFSRLVVEWANQHGCGKTKKSNCNIVIQYMCMNNLNEEEYPTGSGNTDQDHKQRGFYMRDGESTDTQNYNEPQFNETEEAFANRVKKNYQDNKATVGLHESLEYYDICRHREANLGLYHATQRLGRDHIGYYSARRTRQNRGGTQRGFECPEERDYYPYWAPTIQGRFDSTYQRTPWIDAAYLGSNCKDVQDHSFNTEGKFMCVHEGKKRYYGKAISESACLKEKGSWVKFESFMEVLTDVTSQEECENRAEGVSSVRISWMKLRSDSLENMCVVQALAPKCGPAPTTRVNHLGNTPDLTSSRFHWNLPHFPSGATKRCVLRTRYNISTTDYNVDKVSYLNDYMPYPVGVAEDPDVDVFGDHKGLTLAINTAQFGRTFQDRSHVFLVLKRAENMAEKKLYNLNVRGQRGNIVQNYPSVEYDFIPNDLTVSQKDLVHVQWAGHNTNTPGRAGEGTDGTDRHNFVEMVGDLSTSYPKIMEDSEFWSDVESLTTPGLTGKDLAIDFGTVGLRKYCPLPDREPDEIEVTSELSPVGDDKEVAAKCPENYSAVGCGCADGFEAGVHCDGVKIVDGKCIAVSSKNVTKAKARCSRKVVPGKLVYMKKAVAYSEMKHGCPKGYTLLQCVYHSFWRWNRNPIAGVNPDASISNGCNFICNFRYCGAYAICIADGNNERAEVPCDVEGSDFTYDGQLNGAPASFFGHVLKFNRATSLKYMCTRNNNFTNRSQKGALKVIA